MFHSIRRLAITAAAFVALATPTLPDVWVGYMATGEQDGHVVIESAPVVAPADVTPDCVWFNGVCFVNSGLNGTMPISE